MEGQEEAELRFAKDCRTSGKDYWAGAGGWEPERCRRVSGQNPTCGCPHHEHQLSEEPQTDPQDISGWPLLEGMDLASPYNQQPPPRPGGSRNGGLGCPGGDFD